MQRLPVIVAMGGISPAGRTSNHHGYRRLVIDALGQADAESTWQSLSALMGADVTATDVLRDGTLIRQLEPSLLNPLHSYYHRAVKAKEGTELVLSERQLPPVVPLDWQVDALEGGQVKVRLPQGAAVMLPAARELSVQSAGQLPSGFSPKAHYPSRNHPRGLQMTVYGASDAIQSMGIEWEHIKAQVAPDQIGVYAGSALAQLDYEGFAGMMQARLLGKRVTSKQLPLGLPDMPADFINAYLLGSVGVTGCNVGACATFLYNLMLGMEDIRSGRRRVVLVGNSEAPITPEVIDGFGTMGALATLEGLRALDGVDPDQLPDFRRACRPFANNCGFTLAEAAQFTVLMDDELALEMGATILGGVGDVFVNADGYKKSISSPGVGNYLTFAKSLASARAILGEQGVRRSFVQAHGTGTPHNRVTESALLDQCAQTFGINQWPVAAVKSYVGHSISAAAGDQLMSTLGVWRYGLIPGIQTIDDIAGDVSQDHLSILKNHLEVDPKALDVAILNSKGFGGNNASATILAPHVVEDMLARRHGDSAMQAWRKQHEQVQQAQHSYEESCLNGTMKPIYQFGEGVLEGSDLELDQSGIKLKGFAQEVSLELENPYADMCK